MSTISCELHIPEVEGLRSQQLTVGRDFIFKCQGELPVRFNASEARMVLNDKFKYEFFLRKLTINDSKNFDLHMVSYVTGSIKVSEIYVTDGPNQIAVRIADVNVDSVLPAPKENVEGEQIQTPEPYGFMAAHLSWPLGYTISFIIVFCATLALIIQWINKRQRMRKLIRQLKDYEAAMPPDSQFYKGLRQLEKQGYPVREVEKQFRMYVTRKYQVPLFGLTINEAVRFLKKKWPTFTSERRDLKNILLDFQKMQEESLEKASQPTTDARVYLKKIYKFVDATEEKMKHERTLGGDL